MKPTITIFERIHPAGSEILSSFAKVKVAVGAKRKEQIELTKESSAIVIKSVICVDDELVNGAKELQIIGRAGVGTENIKFNKAKFPNIKIISCPEQNIVSTAEFTILQILNLSRKLPAVYSAFQKGDYRRHRFEGMELSCQNIGIVGLGRVGIEVARRLKSFGCKLLAFDPASAYKDEFLSLGGAFTDSLNNLLSSSSIISLHCNFTKENRDMIGKKEFDVMKKDTVLINTARGSLVDNKALLDAINSGKIEAASVDVLDPEPSYDLTPKENDYKHILIGHPKIYATPHIGASTVDAQKKTAVFLATNIKEELSSNS